jgi:hypothetical protein
MAQAYLHLAQTGDYISLFHTHSLTTTIGNATQSTNCESENYKAEIA